MSLIRKRAGRKFCPHCQETVSSLAYQRHRLLYFNASDNTWEHVKGSIEQLGVRSSSESECSDNESKNN